MKWFKKHKHQLQLHHLQQYPSMLTFTCKGKRCYMKVSYNKADIRRVTTTRFMWLW